MVGEKSREWTVLGYQCDCVPGLTGEARVGGLLPEQLRSILSCRFQVREQVGLELLAHKLFSSREKKHSEGHISLRG